MIIKKVDKMKKKKKQQALVIPDDLVKKTFPDISALSIDDLNLSSTEDLFKNVPSIDAMAKGIQGIDDLLSHDVTCPQCGHKFKCKG